MVKDMEPMLLEQLPQKMMKRCCGKAPEAESGNKSLSDSGSGTFSDILEGSITWQQIRIH
jgi:hypothetical protein